MKAKYPDFWITKHAASRAKTRFGIPKSQVVDFIYNRLRSEDTVYIKGSMSSTDRKLRKKGTVETKAAAFSYHDNKLNVVYVCQFDKAVVKLLTVKYPDGDPRWFTKPKRAVPK